MSEKKIEYPYGIDIKDPAYAQIKIEWDALDISYKATKDRLYKEFQQIQKQLREQRKAVVDAIQWAYSLDTIIIYEGIPGSTTPQEWFIIRKTTTLLEGFEEETKERWSRPFKIINDVFVVSTDYYKNTCTNMGDQAKWRSHLLEPFEVRNFERGIWPEWMTIKPE